MTAIGAIERCWSWGRQQIAQEPSAFKSLLLKYVNIAIPVPLNKGGTGATTQAGARANLGIAPTGGFADAPNDGSLYGRRNKSWQAIVGEESFLGVWDVALNDPDLASIAPSGGQYFIVSVAGVAPVGIAGIGGQLLSVGDQVIWSATDSAWVRIPNPGVPDAPSDGVLYGRQDGAWEAVQQGLGPTDIVPVAQGGTAATNASTARTNLGVDTAISTAVASVTQTSLGGPFVTTASLPTTLADYLPLTGGNITGYTQIIDPTFGLYVQGTSTTGLQAYSFFGTAIDAGVDGPGPVVRVDTGALATGALVEHTSSGDGVSIGTYGAGTSGASLHIDCDSAFYGGNSVAIRVERGRTGDVFFVLDETGTLFLGGKRVTFGANDSAAPGYRTMMIEN